MGPRPPSGFQVDLGWGSESPCFQLSALFTTFDDRPDAFLSWVENRLDGRHPLLMNLEEEAGKTPHTCEPNHLCEPPKLWLNHFDEQNRKELFFPPQEGKWRSSSVFLYPRMLYSIHHIRVELP